MSDKIWYAYDRNENYEVPILTLCNPQKKEICVLGNVFKLEIELKFNDLSTLSFTVRNQDAYGNKLDYYDSIVKDRLIHVTGMKWFVIDKANEIKDASIPYKEVKCSSLEENLNGYEINLIKGTYKFYSLDDADDTVMKHILSACPGWKVGIIDDELWDRYRTFDMPDDKSVYSWMNDECSTAFDCVFTFDTDDMTISAIPKNKAMEQTDIFLSLDNVLKSLKVDCSDDNVTTELAVKGADDVSIRDVNPLGTDKMYDFSYYREKTGIDGWMSEELGKAIDDWTKKIDSYSDEYTSCATQLRELNETMTTYKSTLKDMNSYLERLKWQLDEYIKDKEDTESTAKDIEKQESAIKDQQSKIDDLQKRIDANQKNRDDIANDLSFENSFSPTLLSELKYFTHGSTYSNSNYVFTDTMTTNQKIDMEKQLMIQGKEKHKELAYPSFSFTVSSLNVLFIKKFEKFAQQLTLGSKVNLDIGNKQWVTPALLSVKINYSDSSSSFEMAFSNTFKIKNSKWFFDTFVANSSKTNETVSENATAWGLANKSGVTGYVQDMMKYGLDVSKTKILNANDQSIVWDSHGLQGRKMLSNGSFDAQQFRMINNMLAFTKDNWESVSTAIGEIDLPSGGKSYGVNGGTIIGHMVASDELLVSNTANTFKVDANGAELIDAYIRITSQKNKARVVIDPTDSSGIRIQTGKNGSWIDNLSMDMSGNAVLQNIKAQSGTIGGIEITSDRLRSLKTVDSFHDFDRLIDLHADGTGRLGLLAWNSENAWFDGDIHCKGGTIGGFNITSTELASSNGNLVLDASDGSITAKAGFVGGFSLSPDKINSVDGNTSFCTNDTDNSYFKGGTWASYLQDFVTNSNLGDNTVWGGKLSGGTLDYWRCNGDFGSNCLAYDSGFVNAFSAVYGRIGTLEANSITTNYLASNSVNAKYINCLEGLAVGNDYNITVKTLCDGAQFYKPMLIETNNGSFSVYAHKFN